MHNRADGNQAGPARATAYGPHNPHPLSQMRTELVWEGKYDEYGNRREVDVAGLPPPPGSWTCSTSRPSAATTWSNRLLGRQQAGDGVASERSQGEGRPDLHRA